MHRRKRELLVFPQAHILHAVVRLPELKLGSRYFIGLVCGGQDRSLLPLRSGREY